MEYSFGEANDIVIDHFNGQIKATGRMDVGRVCGYSDNNFRTKWPFT